MQGLGKDPAQGGIEGGGDDLLAEDALHVPDRPCPFPAPRDPDAGPGAAHLVRCHPADRRPAGRRPACPNRGARRSRVVQHRRRARQPCPGRRGRRPGRVLSNVTGGQPSPWPGGTCGIRPMWTMRWRRPSPDLRAVGVAPQPQRFRGFLLAVVRSVSCDHHRARRRATPQAELSGTGPAVGWRPSKRERLAELLAGAVADLHPRRRGAPVCRWPTGTRSRWRHWPVSWGPPSTRFHAVALRAPRRARPTDRPVLPSAGSRR